MCPGVYTCVHNMHVCMWDVVRYFSCSRAVAKQGYRAILSLSMCMQRNLKHKVPAYRHNTCTYYTHIQCVCA